MLNASVITPDKIGYLFQDGCQLQPRRVSEAHVNNGVNREMKRRKKNLLYHSILTKSLRQNDSSHTRVCAKHKYTRSTPGTGGIPIILGQCCSRFRGQFLLARVENL